MTAAVINTISDFMFPIKINNSKERTLNTQVSISGSKEKKISEKPAINKRGNGTVARHICASTVLRLKSIVMQYAVFSNFVFIFF